MGAVSDASKRATMKYITEKTDEVKLRLPKGQRKIYQDHAKAMGESTNAFIQRAMRTTMENDLAAKK